MKKITKGQIIKIVALLIDVGVPLVATFLQFPVWVKRSAGATVSGIFVVFVLLSCIPFVKLLKSYFKSPAAWLMWLIFFTLIVAVRSVIDEMLIICFVGALANVIGAIIYKWGDIVSQKSQQPEYIRDKVTEGEDS